MFEDWKGKIIFGVESIILVLLFGTVFNYILQPFLASIHPIFTPQHVPIENRSFRGPDTPAGAAGYLLAGICFYIYSTIKYKIYDYISSIRR
ncbi:hypothetical protein [Halocatena pleomorpha]|uniref:Uncharacterized protein n=1 Tax=Halocatena pleomorpha TaxID=1785090 RepID=A0A3P3RB77_9EURY|nr:hypothetical protein [Halocatena pleomorpha]RRJ30727.1 hypothetical protein EIK79_08830 [Halocatena pleomorpha]